MSTIVKNFLLLILTLATASSVLGDNSAANKTQPSLVVPKTSELTPSAVTSSPLMQASFSGQVWVTGLLTAQWPAEIKTLDPRDTIEVSIKLDEKERSHLPYYDWPEWHKSYIPDSVDITNHDDAIKLVFPKDISAKLLNKKIQLAKVHARFLLADYQIRIECDWPWAQANLISAAVNEVAQISSKTDLGGC